MMVEVKFVIDTEIFKNRCVADAKSGAFPGSTFAAALGNMMFEVGKSDSKDKLVLLMYGARNVEVKEVI